MAKNRKMSNRSRIIGLLFLILVFLIAGSVWFDYLGMIDASGFYAPVFRLFGIQARGEGLAADDPSLLSQLRLQKEQEAMALRETELESRVAELEERSLELDRKAAELEERESVLEEREISFNQRVSRYDNRRENLMQNARDLNSMRLEQAVGILLEYDDQLLIETLRITEELAQQSGKMSLVSVWLSEFPPERAADIQRKMTVRP